MGSSKFKSWYAYISAKKLASEIFTISRHFPKEEKYSLTDQVRRSSRSVCANLAESFAKRRYPKHFISKLTDCCSENDETQVWIDFALDCNYIDQETHQRLTKQSENSGRLLNYMIKNPSQY